MPCFARIILILTVVGVMALASGCSSPSEIPPGVYFTEHQGQTWVIELNQNGTWTGTYGGELLTVGTYSSEGKLITWITDSHCEETGYPGEATYRWNISNDSLTFHLRGADTCLSRKVILEDESYSRQD